MNFPLGTQLLSICRGLQWMINVYVFDRTCQVNICLEPVCLGSNFSSISVVTSGNFLISLCLSFFIWKVGLILALPWDCWEELMNLCVVSTKNMPGTHNVYEHWLYGHFYELRFLVASSAFWRAFYLTLCLLALHKDFH